MYYDKSSKPLFCKGFTSFIHHDDIGKQRLLAYPFSNPAYISVPFFQFLALEF